MKGSLLAGYLEFDFAKQRGGLDPLSLNDQEKGTPPVPLTVGVDFAAPLLVHVSRVEWVKVCRYM